MVVLKTLRQALIDGDNIECIIRETGVNQDGRSPGITMPSHQAHEEALNLIRDRRRTERQGSTCPVLKTDASTSRLMVNKFS